jgi:hypothetical protein
MIHSSRNLQKWRHSKLEFFSKECGGDGDCLFHVLSVSLTTLFGVPFSMQDVRKQLACSISLETIELFLEQVCADQKEYTLKGSTFMQPILSNLQAEQLSKKDALELTQSIICKPGPFFQGTDVVLEWFVHHNTLFKKFSVGFLIFNEYGPSFIQKISNDSLVSILLYNHPNQHWQLALLQKNNEMFSVIHENVYNELISLEQQ